MWYSPCDFANNITFPCFSFDFLIIDLYFLIPEVITKTFNTIEAIAIATEARINKAKAEIVAHPVSVETKITSFYCN